MKCILLTLLFCCLYLVSFGQNSLNSDSENAIKNVIYKQQFYETEFDYSKVKLNVLARQINPKTTEVFGHILQSGGIILMGNSLLLSFILYRFGSSGKDIFYPLAGLFVVGGVIFYTGTRISINANKKIRENLMGIKNTSLFMQNQRVNLVSPNSTPLIGFSLNF
jgi:hypothetical protein